MEGPVKRLGPGEGWEGLRGGWEDLRGDWARKGTGRVSEPARWIGV